MGGAKRLDSGYVLKVEPEDLLMGWVSVVRERSQRWLQGFHLEQWEGWHGIY